MGLNEAAGKPKLAEAICHAISRRAALERFLTDGRIEIDAFVRHLDDLVGGIVDDVGVVAGIALHGVGASAAIEKIVARAERRRPGRTARA
jgi:chloramphenicol 3-O-phosphotransferase